MESSSGKTHAATSQFGAFAKECLLSAAVLSRQRMPSRARVRANSRWEVRLLTLTVAARFFSLVGLGVVFLVSGTGARVQEEDPQLPLVEAIRSDHPERFFELLKTASVSLPENRKLALQALARYRTGEFDEAEALLSQMDSSSADALLVQSLLRAAAGRFQEAEQSVSRAIVRHSELGLLAFEAGLHLNYLLQHLGKPREAAAAVEQLIPAAPFGKPMLRVIAAVLKAAPGEPYRKETVSDDHTIPLLADGSIPSRTVLVLRPDEPGQLVLFDTGSTTNLLRANLQQDIDTGVAVAALGSAANLQIRYGWQKSLTLGGWKLENVPVGFVDKEAQNTAMGNYGAIFGLPFLRRFFVVFDFPRRTMQLLPRAPERIDGDPIPFHYAADQMIIQASINGRHANLLIDTGFAIPSLQVDISWAILLASDSDSLEKSDQLSKDENGPEKPKRLDSPSSQRVVSLQIRLLKFGKHEMKDLPVTVTSLRGRLRETPLAVKIDAVVGAPQLKDYVASIDFEKNRLYLQRRIGKNG